MNFKTSLFTEVLLIFSIVAACSISFYDFVVISWNQNVDVFNENGWVKELPSHIESRQWHGCGYYNNDEGKSVIYVTELFI